MTSSIQVGPALWMDGISTDTSVCRTFGTQATMYDVGSVSAAAAFGGVLNGPGAMAVTAPGGLAVNVSAGFVVIPATLASNGAYLMGMITSGTLTVATADPTNPRIDLVCATVSDLGNAGSTAFVQIITGTPGAVPVAPSLPAASVALAQVNVPATATTITSGNITDSRPWTGPVGSIIPVNGLSNLPAGFPGAFFYDLVTGRLVHNPAGTANQPQVLPFPPVMAISNSGSDPGTSGGPHTLLSATVTTDGNTDIDIYCKWASLYANSGSGNGLVDMRLYIDSTQVDSMIVSFDTGGGGPGGDGGGSYHHYTNSALFADTPAAGTHTVTLQMNVVSYGHTVFVHQGPAYPLVLRVSPVTL